MLVVINKACCYHRNVAFIERNDAVFRKTAAADVAGSHGGTSEKRHFRAVRTEAVVDHKRESSYYHRERKPS